MNILGNWDDFLPDPDREIDNESLRWWKNELREDQWKWLRDLPFSHDFVLSGRRIRLFHASATSVHRRVRFDHDEQEFLGMFENTQATGDGPIPTVVGYGDTHDPFYEADRDRRTLFNTGSVGNSMGDPTPVYVILEGVPDSSSDAPFSIQFVRVPYDAARRTRDRPHPRHARTRRLRSPKSSTASTEATSPPTPPHLPPPHVEPH